MPKRLSKRPNELVKRLRAEGWIERKGKGDHINFKKPGHPTVTIDTGVREIPIGTLRSIYRAAGWKW
ncbi:MAG: type II toxin-antitoxin system HicA family toxin [Methylobacteriaceae bacterium]|nr:type II toxin-antitoxin system HicA family toxin [Methylobacteriaceae bacterium]MBV9243809.1 type II toxin-antitoxin system HicA family toxin [Methylobacteriaceae bacterium]MBV9636336.1 type II toxin-antitoxin system HicA family toxin [Methylobacteriaceae bacterium]MBV9703125.1 type II toxin-antitoxin system HicA family toxin [Methylobacteriaceae bacterium]